MSDDQAAPVPPSTLELVGELLMTLARAVAGLAVAASLVLGILDHDTFYVLVALVFAVMLVAARGTAQ